MTRSIVLAVVLTFAAAFPAAAQLPDLGALLPEGSTSASGRIVQLVALLTVLSLAPGLLIMVTCFTRFIIALSFLRIGIGLQTTPGNLVLVSLALFLTFYVMAPTFDEAWQAGVKPLIEEKIGEEQAFERISAPFKKFMTQHVRDKDVRLFEELAGLSASRQTGDDIELRVLLPAFMISELRRGFEIGFLIVLPFLVIDLIVATLTMSMGMMMLPPTAISLPFKVLFFVLLDGWYLLVGSLVRSYS
ncbi:MAG: flagellar type III secretion system pore protein FliP [Alphaproteobacteria bacterium]|nr:flagellar type III secretion system pore protein FliP [Alphaproteobacteria bacterium]